MASERIIVRETSLFNQQVVYKVYLDENLLLSIVVDLDSMQFSCPQFDCNLDVLSKESTILVKLCTLFKDELKELGVE